MYAIVRSQQRALPLIVHLCMQIIVTVGLGMRCLGVMLPSLYVKRPSCYFYPTLFHLNLEQKLDQI
jgi:hypothetical protein